MVYPTKCTWGCRTYLYLFWRICSTIGSPREPSLIALPRAWSHCWRKVASMFGRVNTEFKILARVLANRLQLVIGDLIGPEQTYAEKERSIQNNLHLICMVLEGIEDGTEAALISLDQSKGFDRVDHRFLATVLKTAGFQPEFCRWISMMYHDPQAVMRMNGKRSGAFAIERSVQQGCPLCPVCPRFGVPAP